MILVTGATGTTGTSVVEELTTSGAEFRAMVRDLDRGKKLLGAKVPLVKANLVDPASLAKAMDGVSMLFLLTPPDARTLTHNANVLTAATNAGVKHVVKLSVIGASADSPLQLGRWHYAVEQQVEESGMAYTFLQAGSFMQNFFHDIPSIRERNAIYSNRGDGKTAFIDTRDIAQIAARILAKPRAHSRKTYVLTGREAVSDIEVAAELSRVLARPIECVHTSPIKARETMERMGLPDWLTSDLLLLGEFAREGHMAEVSPDAKRLLKRQPRTFATFAEDHKARFGG